MKGKLLGIFGLLIALCVVGTIASADPWYDLSSSTFLKTGNLMNLLSRTSMFGILGIGVAFVIITGGIDLSIGSTVCLSGVLLWRLLLVEYVPESQYSVMSVSSSSRTFEMESAGVPFRPGDTLRYKGGKSDSRIYRVAGVAETEGRTIVTMEEGASRDDSGGQLIPTLKIMERIAAEGGVGPETAGSGTAGAGGTRLILEGQQSIQIRDQLNILRAPSGMNTSTVTDVQSDENRTIVTLRDQLPSTVDTNAVAVVLHRKQFMSVPMALLTTFSIAGLLGLIHGLLITRVRLQPFVVTLCALLIYRGWSRWLTGDDAAGFSEYSDSLGKFGQGTLPVILRGKEVVFGIPYPMFFMVAIAIAASILLGRTLWGRYLLALGRSETAARFSGINTGRVTLAAYVICTCLAAVGGILFSLNNNSISPSSYGNFFELYAIAAAVLGGCSLRGGEGSIVGVIIGTAVMQVLNNLIVLLKISDKLEFTIIGSVLLIGVTADEILKRYTAYRRLKQNAAK
ncbi:MAG: hypothetical protein JNL58_19105 [Planctomyces sp.]|nr:hypothetical protein [Planctomyces sp.]